eukprot:5979256-Prymnesium_polylepis.1
MIKLASPPPTPTPSDPLVFLLSEGASDPLERVANPPSFPPPRGCGRLALWRPDLRLSSALAGQCLQSARGRRRRRRTRQRRRP